MLLALLGLLLWVVPATKAQVPIDLSANQNKYEVANSAYVLVDESSSLTIDEVIRPKYAFDFNKDETGMSHGFSDASYWFKFKARSEDLSARWFMEISYPVLDTIELYHLDRNGVWQKTLMGDMLPFYERPVDYRNFLVPLEFTNNSVQLYYMRVRSSSAVRVPVSIVSEWTAHKENLEGEILYGIYFGVMLVMILYNLFIYATLNDFNYIYYVSSIAFAALFFASLSGHAFQYLWFDSVWLANHVIPIAMAGWVMSAAIFARSFLEIKKYSKVLNALLTLIVVLGGVLLLLGIFASYELSTRFGSGVLALNCILMIIAGFTAWRKGNRAARFFTLAWLFFLIGIFILIMMTAGLLPPHPAFEHSSKLGAIMEVVILSLALSDRYSLLKREKEKLQEAALKTQREANLLLEEKVMERTQELTAKTNEIEATNKVLQKQHGEIKKQKEKIDSSIRYAKRIQTVMLPSNEKFSDLLPDSFITYKPRDVVSGDFYWIAEVQDKVVLAGVDCTGHGVPGAFMSILGSNLLNEIVVARNIISPGDILEEMNAGVRKTLNQEDTQNQDGMDMAVCVIDFENRELEYAGAGIPLIYFEGEKEHIIKAERRHIGGKNKRGAKGFTTHSIPFFEPIECYLSSDGYRDQFGGTNGQKFLMKRFKQLLKDIHTYPIARQQEILENTFSDWVGEEEQIDDVLVIGFRIE